MREFESGGEIIGKASEPLDDSLSTSTLPRRRGFRSRGERYRCRGGSWMMYRSGEGNE